MLEFISDPFERLIPREQAAALEGVADDGFRMLCQGPQLWIALHEGGGTLGRDLERFQPGRAVLAGDLEDMPPTEVLDFILRSRRTGMLLATGSGVERALLFREGQILWGTSTDRRERVDELISRVDMIEKAVNLRAQLGRDAASIVYRQVQRVLSGLVGAQGGSFCLLRVEAASLPRLPALDTETLLGECLLEEMGWAEP